jgi:hypothetical protein
MTFAPLIQTTIEHILPSWKIFYDTKRVIRAPRFGGEWVKYVVTKQNNGCVCGLDICIKKYLKAKEELWKLKYFTMQKSNPQKIL